MSGFLGTGGYRWRGENATAAAVADTDFTIRSQVDYALIRTAVTNAPPNAQNIGALASGILYSTVSGGVSTVSIAVAGTAFANPNAYYFVNQATPAAGPNQVNLGALASGVPLLSVSGAVATFSTLAMVSGQIPVGAPTGGGLAQYSGLTWDTSNSHLEVRNTGSEQIRIGYAGVASADYSLGRVTGGGALDGYLMVKGNYPGQAGFVFGGTAANFVAIDTSGRLGVGTTTPGALVEIFGGTSSDQLRMGGGAGVQYKIGRNSSDGMLDLYGDQSTYTGFRFTGVDGQWMQINGPASTSGAVTINSLGGGTQALVYATTGGILGRALLSGLSISGGTLSNTGVLTVGGTAAQIASTGGQNPVLSLINTAVAAGSYNYASITVDAQGRLTAASSGTPVTSLVPGTNVTISGTTAVTVNAVPAGSSGQLQYNAGSNLLGANSNLSWDISNGRLGIGYNVPLVTLDVQNAVSSQMRVGYSVSVTGDPQYSYDIGRVSGGGDDGLFRIYGNSASQYGFLFTGLTGGDYLRIAHGGVTTVYNLAGGTQALVYTDTTGALGRVALSGLTLSSGTLSVTSPGITQLTGDVTAGPGSGSQVATIAANAVTDAKLRQGGARTVIGRSASATGNVADIGAVNASDSALRENGGTIGFGTLATNAYANGSVTYAKFQSTSAASVLIGRGAGSGSGSVQEITLGTGLSLSGTTLNATGTVTSVSAGTGITITGTTAVTVNSNLSTGVSGGQTAYGGTASANNLVLTSTTHATTGIVRVVGAETVYTSPSLTVESTSSVGQPALHFKTNGTLRAGVRGDYQGALNHFSTSSGSQIFYVGGDAGTNSLELTSGNVVKVSSLNAGGMVYAAVTTGALGIATISSPISYSSGTLSHATSGVTAATYLYPQSFVVDAKGHLTSVTGGNPTYAMQFGGYFPGIGSQVPVSIGHGQFDVGTTYDIEYKAPFGATKVFGLFQSNLNTLNATLTVKVYLNGVALFTIGTLAAATTGHASTTATTTIATDDRIMVVLSGPTGGGIDIRVTVGFCSG